MKSIGLYIHIPFCIKKCNYCDFASVAGKIELLPRYIDALCQEIELAAVNFKDSLVKTIFLGGGTPSVLPVDAYGRIMLCINGFFNVGKDAEISLEANPGTLSDEKAYAMRSAGFNRISIGVQAVQDKLLEQMGRIHRRKDVEDAMRIVCKAGFENINLDLMFGLPGQTMQMWRESLDFALSAPIKHLSFYSLSVEDNTAWGEMQSRNELSALSDEVNRNMYYYAIKQLSASGFSHYEISNAALPGYTCKHNLIYWERGDYLGLGAGAHSLSSGHRCSNVTDIDLYIKYLRDAVDFAELRSLNDEAGAEQKTLTEEDVLSEKLFLGLRLLKGVDIVQVSVETGINISERYFRELKSLESDGLITSSNNVIRLTDKGLDLANKVFEVFV